jgi:hypothetical protein
MLKAALDVYVKITDYQILDPAHHNVEKNLSYVLYIGDDLTADRKIKLAKMSQKAWVLSPPNPNDTTEQKKEWLGHLEKIKDYMLDLRDRDHIKKADIPTVQSLQEYLNSKTGQVIELTLPDRRKLGVYPDGHRLQSEFDIEYHASTVVNLAKLFQLFDASEIIIKEI